jgi:hypothetical protein
MQCRKGQGHIRMEKTNRPIMQNHKGPARTRMEKTHQVITQGRKDRAQPDRLREWARAPRKAPAPLEPQQGQADIKDRFF